MQPNEFWFYYAGLMLLAILLVFWRRPRRGMRLRLRGGQSWSRPFGLEGEPLETYSSEDTTPGRMLNVVFNYNGHSWDAYEVLGVPAGSAPEQVDEAYKKCLSRVDPASRPFIEAAYRAILEAKGQRLVSGS